MKVLVTGGTGFLGKRLVQKLLESGDQVRVFCRNVKDDLPEDVELYTGDIRDKAALRKAFSGVDIVYHLAVCLNEADPLMYEINIKGTQNVVELCKEAKVQQLVYMGSSGVVGETREASKENMPYNPKTLYEKSKAESEKMIKNSGITYTIVRTTIVIGPNMIWAQIFEAARKRYPIIGSGKNYFHLVFVDDVVRMLLTVKNNNKAINQVFNVATKDTPTYEEVYGFIAKELHTTVPEKHVPLWIAYFGSFLHSAKRKAQGKQPSLIKMKSSIDRLVRNRIISTEKAKAVLGFEPQYTTPEAIHETLKYLKIARLGYSDYDLTEIKKAKEENNDKIGENPQTNKGKGRASR